MVIIEQEEAFVNAFVVARKRERYFELLRSRGRRRDFLRQLYHFRDFIPSCIVTKDHRSADDILSELQRRGAGPVCYIISVHDELDGQTDQLANVVRQVYARQEGTIVSCIPGRLAYYEGEPPKNRFILSRK